MQFWTAPRISFFEDKAYLLSATLQVACAVGMALLGFGWGAVALLIASLVIPLLRLTLPWYLVLGYPLYFSLKVGIVLSVIMLMWARWLRLKNIPYNRS